MSVHALDSADTLALGEKAETWIQDSPELVNPVIASTLFAYQVR